MSQCSQHGGISDLANLWLIHVSMLACTRALAQELLRKSGRSIAAVSRGPRTDPSRSPAEPPRAALAADHPAFDRVSNKKRNVVERCFNRLKQWRNLATRYTKRASLYRTSLILIAAAIWLP
jgi:transposase